MTIPAAAERTTPLSRLVHSVQSLMAEMLAPVGDPITTPTPIRKPDREIARTPPSLEYGTVAKCGYATVVAQPSPGKDTPLYRINFAPDMIDDMVGKGCAQFYQGCNICTVAYVGCDESERAACKDAACLEKTCERRVRCSVKTCTAQGKAPTCESRLVRATCRRQMFE